MIFFAVFAEKGFALRSEEKDRSLSLTEMHSAAFRPSYKHHKHTAPVWMFPELYAPNLIQAV